jgi:hypothetical protein
MDHDRPNLRGISMGNTYEIGFKLCKLKLLQIGIDEKTEMSRNLYKIQHVTYHYGRICFGEILKKD